MAQLPPLSPRRLPHRRLLSVPRGSPDQAQDPQNYQIALDQRPASRARRRRWPLNGGQDRRCRLLWSQLGDRVHADAGRDVV